MQMHLDESFHGCELNRYGAGQRVIIELSPKGLERWATVSERHTIDRSLRSGSITSKIRAVDRSASCVGRVPVRPRDPKSSTSSPDHSCPVHAPGATPQMVLLLTAPGSLRRIAMFLFFRVVLRARSPRRATRERAASAQCATRSNKTDAGTMLDVLLGRGVVDYFPARNIHQNIKFGHVQQSYGCIASSELMSASRRTPPGSLSVASAVGGVPRAPGSWVRASRPRDVRFRSLSMLYALQRQSQKTQSAPRCLSLI